MSSTCHRVVGPSGHVAKSDIHLGEVNAGDFFPIVDSEAIIKFLNQNYSPTVCRNTVLASQGYGPGISTFSELLVLGAG